MTRLLLPFTHGVDTQAIEVAVRFAHYHQATLISLALIPLPPRRWFSCGPRLEAFQQAQDFFEVVRCKAERHAVPVERVQLVTSDIIESIFTAARTHTCEHTLLLMRQKKGLLLNAREITSLLGGREVAFYLIHLLTTQHKQQSKRGVSAFQMQPGIDSASVAYALPLQEARCATPGIFPIDAHTTQVDGMREITI